MLYVAADQGAQVARIKLIAIRQKQPLLYSGVVCFAVVFVNENHQFVKVPSSQIAVKARRLVQKPDEQSFDGQPVLRIEGGIEGKDARGRIVEGRS